MTQKLGQAILELAANTARFTSDLGRALSAAEKFKRDADRAFKTIGVGLSIAGFTAFIKANIDAADRLNDLRTRTGQTGQQLLVMEGAALRSGVQLEAVSQVASRLSKRLEDARGGTGEAANAFAAMGIKVTDSTGRLKSLDTILKEAGAKFRTYEDGADKATLATAAFGKGGDMLIPVAEALEETEERFRKLGITIDEDMLSKADEFNDRMEDAKSVMAFLGRGIAAELLPHLINAANAMLEFSKDSDAVKTSVNALIIPLKVFASGFVTAGSAIAAASELLVGWAIANERIAKLDFKGAFDEMSIALDRAKERFDSGARIVSAFWNTMESGAKKADEATRRIRPPQMVDLQKLKQASEALEKLLDQRTKLAVDAEKDAGEKTLQILDKRYSMGLVGEREYWTQRHDIQQQALATELRLLDEQIGRQRGALSGAVPNTKEYHDAQRELEDTLAKRAKLERDALVATTMGSLEALNAARQYETTIENLNADLEEMRGNIEKAFEIRQGATSADIRRRFMANGDQAALKLLNDVERLQRSQARFNALREDQEDIGARLQIQEERIQNSLRTGAISELEALQRTGAARQAAAADLEKIVQNLEEVARASENPKLVLQAEHARFALEKLRAESDLIGDKFRTIFEDSFVDGLTTFTDELRRTGKVIDALGKGFERFATGVIREIEAIQAKNLARAIMGEGGVGGSIPGFLGRLLGLGGQSDSAAIAVGQSYSGGAMSGAMEGALLGSFATGTDFVPRTGPYLLHEGEEVVPAHERSRRGQVHFTQINHIDSRTDATHVQHAMAVSQQRSVAAMEDLSRRRVRR